MNYYILFAVIVLAIVAGQMLTQSWLLAQAKRRRKHAQREFVSRPKPEPQVVEFKVILTGVDDLEAGLARAEAALERIAEAAGGMPVTVNNYYSEETKPWRYYCPHCRGVFEDERPSKPGVLVVKCPDCGYQSLVGGSKDKWYTINPDRLQDDVELCSHGCHYEEPYGFVPMAGCPIHD